MQISVVENFTSPALFGTLHPLIILPNIDYTDKELYYIFLHELLHIKHKDFLIKFLCDLLVVIYWWNPVIFRLYPSLLQQVQELHVDYSILTSLQQNEKVPYLESLQKTLAYSSTLYQKKLYITYTFCDVSCEKKILQRIFFITKSHVKGISKTAVALSVLLVLSSCSFVFEALKIPEYSENGDKVFYMSEDNSYFIKNDSEYDLYLDGKYVYTTPQIIADFKHLPIYHTPPKGGLS